MHNVHCTSTCYNNVQFLFNCCFRILCSLCFSVYFNLHSFAFFPLCYNLVRSPREAYPPHHFHLSPLCIAFQCIALLLIGNVLHLVSAWPSTEPTENFAIRHSIERQRHYIAQILDASQFFFETKNIAVHDLCLATFKGFAEMWQRFIIGKI